MLRLTSLEDTHNGCGGGRYYSVDGFHLTDGLHAAPPNDAEDGHVLPSNAAKGRALLEKWCAIRPQKPPRQASASDSN